MPSVTLSREKEIIFNEKRHTVRRMTLGQYARFMEVLQEIIPGKEKLTKLIEGSTPERFEVVMELLKSAPAKIAELANIASGIPAEDVLNAYPEQLFELGKQVYEINNLQELGGRLKKVLSLGQAGQAKTE